MGMGKVMVQARPGALVEILSQQSKSQLDFANANGISRKTLQRIEKGLPVKDSTLANIAVRLRVPPEHLLPNKSVPAVVTPELSPPKTVAKDAKVEKEDFLARAEVFLHVLDGNGIADIVDFADRIEWRLDARPNTATIPNLRELEKATLHLYSRVSFSYFDLEEDIHTLDFQLKKIEAIESVDRLLKVINNGKLHVLGANYLYWNREQEDGHRVGYTDVYSPDKVKYTSERIAFLCIENISIKSKRVELSAGWNPPMYSVLNGPQVWVNGKLLPIDDTIGGQVADMEVDDSYTCDSDGVPYNKSDDIPF
jgi:transcriptional regulator with XRE-family HTH domain